MSPLEYAAFRSRSLNDYPDDVAKASGASLEVASEFGRKQIEEMLPAGRLTPNHFFYRIVESEFICDIFIEEKQRGRGLGKTVMKLLEARALEIGATQLILHVFGHNPGARRLYETLGFYETNINMRKDLK